LSSYDSSALLDRKNAGELPRNDYEPDVCFWRAAQSLAFQRGQLKFPPPDFIAEVLSPTTEKVDRGVKFEDYAANGVGEHWLIEPRLDQVEQYLLIDGPLRNPGDFGSATSAVPSSMVSMFQCHVRYVAWSADHKRALSASNGALQLTDLESGQCLRKLKAHSGGVYCAAYDLNHHRALSGSRDQTVRV
jgi:WD40 repeat protein